MSKLEALHPNIQPNIIQLPKFAKILIVENQRFDRMRLRRLIETLDFDTLVVQVDCLETMKKTLQNDPFDLIILNDDLPDGTGLQALDLVFQDAFNRTAATVLVTHEKEADSAIEALKRGLGDYITKEDLTHEALRRATINALQKSKRRADGQSQISQRQLVQSLSERFSHDGDDALKQVLSQLMRQLRELRETQDLPAVETGARYGGIDKSCMQLWDLLTVFNHDQNAHFTDPNLAASHQPSNKPTGPDTLFAQTAASVASHNRTKQKPAKLFWGTE
ncbi:MAG: response regulator [Roseobacter sp.]